MRMENSRSLQLEQLQHVIRFCTYIYKILNYSIIFDRSLFLIPIQV